MGNKVPFQSPIESDVIAEGFPAGIKRLFLQGVEVKLSGEATYNLAPKRFSEDDFVRIKVLEKGGYGKVVLVQRDDEDLLDESLFAMKIIKKDQLFLDDSIDDVKNEKYLLAGMNHPFIINLKYAFQSYSNLFLVMNYIPGGNLRTHLKRTPKGFPLSRVKFYCAQIVEALEYLHSFHIIHRDIKLSNILLNSDGYLILTDFGFASFLKRGKLSDVCGTVMNICPQMLKREKYSYEADWWSFGTCVYEMLYGRNVFMGNSVEEVKRNILEKEVVFPEVPAYDDVVKGFVRGLLERDPKKRLGKVLGEVKKHPFFKGMNFKKLLKKKIKPDYLPVIVSPLDTSNFIDDKKVDLYTPSTPGKTDDIFDKKYYDNFKEFSFHEANKKKALQEILKKKKEKDEEPMSLSDDEGPPVEEKSDDSDDGGWSGGSFTDNSFRSLKFDSF